ncbi:MAG: PEP-CTERM sorting domain-containing protein [Phycisphaerae bacterium]
MKALRFLMAAALLAALTASASAFQISINEIRIDQGGSDLDEYFELTGAPGASLNGLSYIVIGDCSGDPSGVGGCVEAIVPLTGMSIPADGFFLAVENTFTAAPAAQQDLVLAPNGINFENSDNVTHMLVSGLDPSVNLGGNGFGGTDFDINDDGIIDALIDTNNDAVPDSVPFVSMLDSIALIEDPTVPPPFTELAYGPNQIGPDGPFVPAQIFRLPDGSGAWNIGSFGPVGLTDTPGVTNVPEPASLALLAIGGLALIRRRR